MTRLKLILPLMLAVSSLAVPALAQAEALSLDVHPAAGRTTAAVVTSHLTVPSGSHYTVTVAGTVSIWSAARWRSATGAFACGASEGSPLFSSPGIENGPVGWDAETLFAVPPGGTTGYPCSTTSIPSNRSSDAGGFKIDNGDGFVNRVAIGGDPTVPSPDHNYTYDVVSTGVPLKFAFIDNAGQDDYGVFSINVARRGTSGGGSTGGGATVGTETGSGATTVPKGSTVGGESSVFKTLPSSKRCVSRRSFSIKVKAPRGVEFSKATIKLNGKTLSRKITKSLLTGKINFKGSKKGTYKLSIRVVTTRGQVLTAKRTYHLCVKKKTTSKSKSSK